VLLSTSQIYPVALLLRSSGNGANLFDDLFRLSSAVNSGEFEPDCIKPLLRSAVTDTPDDTVIWNHLYEICHWIHLASSINSFVDPTNAVESEYERPRELVGISPECRPDS
jgi:hypothetical protein